MVHRPAYDFRRMRVGCVHLGLGAFHRAHQALYTDEALGLVGGDWGIAAASLRHPDTPDALSAQDGLYCVETLDSEVNYRIVASIRSALCAPREPALLRAALAAPATHIVTLTVTEKGYYLGPDGQLDVGHADIQTDLAGQMPMTAIGWLAESLHARFISHGQPVTIISCDNLKENGIRLESAVVSFMTRRYPNAVGWCREHVRFPRTVVDCIVPAATDVSRARVSETLGVADQSCVQREGFSQWVIENRFAGPRPAWEHAGAQIVADVTDYGRLKLHVLNTCHSALAYLGLPRGHRLVRDAVADLELSNFLESLVQEEIAPALTGLAVMEYWRSVRARFANPRIDHRLDQIAQDGAKKLSERVFPLLIANLAAGAPIGRLARIVAGWAATAGTKISEAFADPALFPAALRENSGFRRLMEGMT